MPSSHVAYTWIAISQINTCTKVFTHFAFVHHNKAENFRSQLLVMFYSYFELQRGCSLQSSFSIFLNCRLAVVFGGNLHAHVFYEILIVVGQFMIYAT